jgi:hypothetical protein
MLQQVLVAGHVLDPALSEACSQQYATGQPVRAVVQPELWVPLMTQPAHAALQPKRIAASASEWVI